MPDDKKHLDALLKDPQAVLNGLHAKFGVSNCPLTAAAAFTFLETGVVRTAKRTMAGLVTVQCGNSKKMSFDGLIADLKKAGHGTHYVVTKDAGTPNEHSANFVNIRGKIYLLDAYTKKFTSDFRDGWGGKKLEVSSAWRIKIVPQDKINSSTCD